MGRGLLQILVHLQKDIIFFLKKYWISSKDLLVFRGNSKTRKHFCKICWQIVCCRPDIENNFSIFSDSINGKGDEEPLIWPPASNRPIQQFSVVFLKVFNEKNPLFQPNYLYFFFLKSNVLSSRVELSSTLTSRRNLQGVSINCQQ